MAPRGAGLNGRDLRRLARYRADRTVPTLAHGTTLHQLVFLFLGTEFILAEQIAEDPM